MILTAATSIGVFLLAFWFTDVVTTGKSAIETIRNAMQAIRNPALDELEREHTVQAAAVRLVVASSSLILRSLLALSAAFIPIIAADFAGIVPQAAMLDFMGRWDVIVVATVAVTLGYVVGLRVWSR